MKLIYSSYSINKRGRRIDVSLDAFWDEEDFELWAKEKYGDKKTQSITILTTFWL